jgi:hypothetical protein
MGTSASMAWLASSKLLKGEDSVRARGSKDEQAPNCNTSTKRTVREIGVRKFKISPLYFLMKG